ncbi:hypothetical protein FKM82_023562 [Ascaphus truei]
MHLPANHPSCNQDGGPLTGEREQTSLDTFRRRALVRPEARRSPTAVVTPSAAEMGSDTAPEEPKITSRQRSSKETPPPPYSRRAKTEPAEDEKERVAAYLTSADRMIHHRPFRSSTHFRCVTTEQMEIPRAPTMTSLPGSTGKDARERCSPHGEQQWPLPWPPCVAKVLLEDHGAQRREQPRRCPLVAVLPACWTLI